MSYLLVFMFGLLTRNLGDIFFQVCKAIVSQHRNRFKA